VLTVLSHQQSSKDNPSCGPRPVCANLALDPGISQLRGAHPLAAAGSPGSLGLWAYLPWPGLADLLSGAG